jgi:uncharacterized protein
MSANLITTLLAASVLAFALAWLSSVGGMGGGVLMLLVFTALFGLRIAIPVLTLAQLASNGGRVWFNRHDIRWYLIRWHAIGAIPLALAGGLLLTHIPVDPLKRLLGAALIATLVWRRLRPVLHRPGDRMFVAVGAWAGLGSSLLGAAGPIAAPFFLAKGLVGGVYIGTEAGASLVIHLTKVAAYGAGSLLSLHVIGLGLMLTPSIVAGAWLGKRTVARMSTRAFVLIVEAGMLAGAILLLAGL